MRTLLLTLALLAASPALAEPFPAETDAWHYEGRAKPVAGEARFARLDGTPDGKAGWRVTVVCGRVHLRTGREVVTFRGVGVSERGRMGAFGGTFSAPDGPLQGFLIDQQGEELNDQRILFAADGEDRVCPNGVGDINTGD